MDDDDESIAVFGLAGLDGTALDDNADATALADLCDAFMRARDALFGQPVTVGEA